MWLCLDKTFFININDSHDGCRLLNSATHSLRESHQNADGDIVLPEVIIIITSDALCTAIPPSQKMKSKSSQTHLTSEEGSASEVDAYGHAGSMLKTACGHV